MRAPDPPAYDNESPLGGCAGMLLASALGAAIWAAVLVAGWLIWGEAP